ATANVGIEDGAGRAHLHVEARSDHGGCIRVEEQGDLVARRVLELLDHQLATPRGRGPVHAAQRLALLVLTHAVKLEPARPPQLESPSVVRADARLREEAAQPLQPWIHEQSTGSRERDRYTLEPERVAELGAHLLEGVAPAGDALQDVASAEVPAVAPQGVALLTESTDALDEGERGGKYRPDRLQLHDDRDVVTLQVLAVSPAAAGEERPIGQPYPDPGDRGDEQQPRRHRVQRPGAERPRRHVDAEAEREDESSAPGGHSCPCQ